MIVGQDVEFKISQDRMPPKENIQDVGWYWQQQRIVHCNSSFCQLEDCKIPCPQFQPKLMIKGTTLLLTRVGEEEDGLELQCRIYPHTMGTIINTESTPQVYKFKIDVLPTGQSSYPFGESTMINIIFLFFLPVNLYCHKNQAS